MRMMLAAVVLLAVGVIAFVVVDPLEGPEDDLFHPDHSEVFNGFQKATSALVGNDGVGSVPPDSECKQVEDTTWRCYRRWAPVGRPEAAELLEADVEVYDDRVVVGDIRRTPDRQ